MKQETHKDSLYAYLEPFLETGSPEDIAQARKQYWRQYKAKWRKEKRKENKEFTISVTNSELRTLSTMAAAHHTSCSRFIKEAALAYSTKKSMTPNIHAINHIRELMTLTCTEIQHLEESGLISIQTEELLIQKLSALEQTIMEFLQNPKSKTNDH